MPPASCAAYDTVVIPTGKKDVGVWLLFILTMASQSLGVGMVHRLPIYPQLGAPWFSIKGPMSVGQLVQVGAVFDTTLNTCVWVLVLPCESVYVQVTVVWPNMAASEPGEATPFTAVVGHASVAVGI